MKYIKRVLESKVREYLKSFSVVGITGPRQSGKSTMLLSLLKDYAYVTFDDYKVTEFFQIDPEGFMQVYADKVIFDEVQRVPEIFSQIKLMVDKDRQRYGKFVLTGSSQFAFLKNISESLAGRIGLLSLLPLQYQEIAKPLHEQSIFKGGYPELVNRKYQHAHDWYASYFDTYLNKDVRSVAGIGDLRDFQRFLSLLAANTSQLLNMSRYASDLGVSVTTIKRWLSVLEASYIIFLLPPFHNNYGKRLIKNPKIYFYDTGLVCYLVGVETKELYERGPMSGSIFENYLISEILKKELHRKSGANLYFLRTSQGIEVDLIIDRKTSKTFIEIKNTTSFRPKMLDAIEQFKSEKDQAYLLYKGDLLPARRGISILHYGDYLKYD